ncbi:hypothetical protein ABPG75_002005 [Micractinium tetrahymenae]
MWGWHPDQPQRQAAGRSAAASRLLSRFDAALWRAEFRSAREGVRPSSDAPLHAAALGLGAAQRYSWEEPPLVAVHGHALAEGAGGNSHRNRDTFVIHPCAHPGWSRRGASQRLPSLCLPLPLRPRCPAAGLERARQAGLPISDHETLFSTPEDRQALEALFRSHPYPRHRCYIRRGHGFLLLAQSVQEAEAYLEQHVLPLAEIAE